MLSLFIVLNFFLNKNNQTIQCHLLNLENQFNKILVQKYFFFNSKKTN
jgi:hypothetical protein